MKPVSDFGIEMAVDDPNYPVAMRLFNNQYQNETVMSATNPMLSERMQTDIRTLCEAGQTWAGVFGFPGAIEEPEHPAAERAVEEAVNYFMEDPARITAQQNSLDAFDVDGDHSPNSRPPILAMFNIMSTTASGANHFVHKTIEVSSASSYQHSHTRDVIDVGQSISNLYSDLSLADKEDLNVEGPDFKR